MSKLKRPEKIQTTMNGATGANSANSSPSLSAAKRPPSAQIPPPSATSNGMATSGPGSRATNRTRRDAPNLLLGRGQRTSSAGLRSASIVPDTAVTQASEPRPYVQSDAYILKKYKGCSPSLIVHLHPNHFRFDQQDGTFSYKSSMRVFIEHLRLKTVPHVLLENFTAAGISFYEGCLIVEIHDHKSNVTARSKSLAPSSAEKSEPFSLHNWNACLTPSPYVPYPKDDALTPIKKDPDNSSDDAAKPKTSSDKDKENMPAPNQLLDSQRNRAAKTAKIMTIVLHPTPLAAHVDLAIKASTPVVIPAGNRKESRADVGTPISVRPQTPLLAIPPGTHGGMEPPAKRVKREKMELDTKNIYAVEAQITLATTAQLFLEPVHSAEACSRLLEALSHPEHNAKVPSPKSRKKTVAEMAAEESATKNEQQFMLTLDELRHSSVNGAPGGANPSDGEGQAGATSWEPRFESFRAIENIKLQSIENKKKEKLQQAEAAKRQQQEAEQQRAKAQAELAKRQEEENRQRLQQREQQREQQQQQAQREQNMKQQQLREQQRRAQQMAAQQAAQAQQLQHNMQGNHPQMNQPQVQHAHPPQQNGGIQNPMNAVQQQQQRLMQQQQFTQGQASSPIIRNATPHNLSSPMVATNMGVSMQQSTSSMGGSPPRPGSVVQQGPQMTPGMSHAMRTQGSQQSHGGTPRPMNATPNMPQSGPRQLNQTPHMAMTPMPGVPQMGGNPPQMMMQNPQMNALQIQQAQLQQQNILRQQAAQQAGMASSPPGFGMTPQQQMAMQRMAQQQGNPQMMSNNQMSQQYAAQMRQMAHAQQTAAAMQQNGNQNFMAPNGMNAQMMQARVQQQMLQQQAAAQQQQQQVTPQQMQIQQIRMMSTKFYQNGLQELTVQWNGNIPEQVMQNYKQQCSQKAQALVSQRIAQQRQQQQQQQQQQMGQNVNMMPNMVRPPGM